MLFILIFEPMFHSRTIGLRCLYHFSPINSSTLWRSFWWPSLTHSSTQEDWNYHEEPVPARPHDAWQMKLSGSMPGLKGNTRVTVTIEGYAKQTVDMYRDIKAVLFPGKPGINVFVINYFVELYFCHYRS